MVSELLKYIDYVLDDVRNVEAHQSRNLYVDKNIRMTLATAYHETKKYVEKIRAECPGIKDVPADSTDPKEYLRNAHTWCVGQLYWKDGERIGVEEATAASASKEPAETGQEIKSVKKPSEAMTEKDRQLFLEIGADIKKHPEKYREAGKWLNKYYSIENFWQQREEELKMLKGLHTSKRADETENYKIEYLQLMIDLKVYIPISSLEFWFLTHEKSSVDTTHVKPETNDKIKSLLAVLDLSEEEQGRWMFENLPEYRDSDLSLGPFAFSMWKPLMDQIRVMKPPPVKGIKNSLERWRNLEKEPAISYRFRDARNALLWKCWGSKEFLSREEAERILLLTWLISAPEAEQLRLGITEFENWAWNEGLRGRDFVYYETFIEDFEETRNKWIKLVHLAWAKLKAEKDLAAEKPAVTGQRIAPAKRGVILDSSIFSPK
ncbi:hypothetical protein ES703_77956 [subsurface metagenome]